MIRRFVVVAMFAIAAGITAIGAAPMAAAQPYANCTEAREAGDTDIPASSDYYGEHLDRDLDGIGCES